MPLTQLKPGRNAEAAKIDDTGLRKPILATIEAFAANAPRSLQRAVGPSQVGTPCARQLAFAVSDRGGTRNFHDAWPSIVGTACHAWLADAFDWANTITPGTWLTEQRVDVGFGLRGSSDVFHVPSGTVIDWKVLGDTQYRKYVTEGVEGTTYEVQTHCYGLGFMRAGYVVNRVAIAFFGRAKSLHDLHIWSAPFNPDIALRALDRMRTIQRVIASGADPMRITETPGSHCFFCTARSANDGKDGYCCPKGKS